jgi:hypothetical protein
MKTLIKPTKRIALEVAKSINGALCRGAGSGQSQNVCVMQAIARAVGLPTSNDQVEECVGSVVGAFNRKLNDCYWSSDVARAEGMKRLGVASIGSNQLNQMEYGKLMFLRGTQKLLPFVFREIAKIKDGNYKAELKKHADLCEKVKTFDEAKAACKAASASASAPAYASAYAYAYASAPASAYAYAYASASASASAYAYAYAYASASASASASADFKGAKLGENDRLLLLTSQVGLDCLKELKSPGCKFLRFVN